MEGEASVLHWGWGRHELDLNNATEPTKQKSGGGGMLSTKAERQDWHVQRRKERSSWLELSEIEKGEFRLQSESGTNHMGFRDHNKRLMKNHQRI